ncbi:MAG: sugar transporter, partial [Bacteroidales bacterium]|nr:sugar transporter [Bacteroidales bacterium]
PYLMPKTALIWLMGSLFIRLFRNSTDIFISAYGLFKDIGAPLIEATLNIGLSTLFGYFWGLPGILAGVFTSLFVIVFLWKPFFLFREKMGQSPVVYFKRAALSLILVAVSILSTYYIKNLLPIDPAASYGHWLLYGLCTVLICGGISFLLFYLFTPGMRTFSHRLVNLLPGRGR